MHLFKALVYLLVIIFSCIKVCSQESIFKNLIFYGEYYINNKEYEKALNLYLEAYNQNSENSFLNYRIGECLYNIKEKRFEAIEYLEKAKNNIKKTKKDNLDYNSAPYEVLFLLGDLYQRSNQLDKALEMYLDYKEYIDIKNNEDIEKINFKIQSVAIARNYIENPVNVYISNLGPIVNSRFSDYNPVVSADESILIFTSFWESADLIFMSRKINGKWSQPINISSQLNTDGSFYTTSLSADGKILLLIKQNDYESDIYISYFRDSIWSPAIKIPGKINSQYHESSACISSDGKYIIFSSNRPGGYGGFDLYISEFKNENWTNPKNLGSEINTKYNEEAPQITEDGKILFFCSEGHRNMGGYDIFFTTKQEDGSWSMPKNLGYPINTTDDDLFFVPVKNGLIGYCSKHGKDGYGKNDIYRYSFIKDQEEMNINLLEKERTEKNSDNLSSDNDNIKDDSKLAEKSINIELPEVEKEQKFANEKVTKQMDNNENTSIDKIYPEPNFEFIESKDTLTIQIIAVKKELSRAYFKEFNDIKVYKGKDNIYRYYVGEFTTYSEANEYLKKVRKFGYTDAFIRTYRSLRN